MSDHYSALTADYFERRLTEIESDMQRSAMHPRGAADEAALRGYMGWLRQRWARVSPKAVMWRAAV